VWSTMPEFLEPFDQGPDSRAQARPSSRPRPQGSLVVVTLKSLQGPPPIEDYGYQPPRASLARLGQKEKNTGALLIVAPNERKVAYRGSVTASRERSTDAVFKAHS